MTQSSSSNLDNQPDPLLGGASELLQTAQINATRMFTTLRERFPVLRPVDVEHSDFILTVAGVFIACTRLRKLQIGNRREEMLLDIVADCVESWRPDGIVVFDDCRDNFDSELARLKGSGHGPRFVESDALGKWIVWKLLERQPESDSERTLVRVAGGTVVNVFTDWWNPKNG